MYISDACKAASTTKKAIEYYCEKGLIKPAATEPLNLPLRQSRYLYISKQEATSNCLLFTLKD